MGDQHPLLYELNARQWLYELSSQAGRRITLSDVPESEFLEWNRVGFTHIWLMGVWKCGPIIDAERDHWAKLLPDFRDEDAVPSPYAVTAYIVDEQLGGPVGLEKFRERLQQHGLKLVLDFVPNHASSVHEWTRQWPELFVRADKPVHDTFKVGEHWIAHGKDPYFPAWIDTAQLDYRNPETRAVMIAELLKVSDLCDGVRCDMSMLLLNDVFARTWKELPSQHQIESEFWAEAITRVKQHRPQFLFLAEAYWDLEQRLLDLGFDFAYDKRVYDHLIAHDVQALSQHLRSKSIYFLNRATHFLENHDEERIATRLNLEEHCAAALLTLCLPGMRLLHHGQLTGARLRASVHLRRWAAEPTNRELTAFYGSLLLALRGSAVGKGDPFLIRNTADGIFALQWRSRPTDFDLALVNLGTTVAEFALELERAVWRIDDLLRLEAPPITTDSFQINLKPLATKFLRFSKLS